MSPLPDPLPFYVVIGSEPDKPPRALEIFMEVERADNYVLDGVMQAMMLHRGGVLQPGEQISMLLTLGIEDVNLTTASVAVNGDDHRHVWDFRVEKRWAPKP
jgi:hypothetical protein